MEKINLIGIITQRITDITFKVRLDSDNFITARKSIKLHLNGTRLVPGDKVMLELNAKDKNYKNVKIIETFK